LRGTDWSGLLCQREGLATSPSRLGYETALAERSGHDSRVIRSADLR